MLHKSLLASGLLLTAAMLVPQTSFAAPASPQTPVPLASEGFAVEQVHFRRRYRYCRYWRHECADRWGWGTRRYYRCLRRHGCHRWH